MLHLVVTRDLPVVSLQNGCFYPEDTILHLQLDHAAYSNPWQYDGYNDLGLPIVSSSSRCHRQIYSTMDPWRISKLRISITPKIFDSCRALSLGTKSNPDKVQLYSNGNADVYVKYQWNTITQCSDAQTLSVSLAHAGLALLMTLWPLLY